MAQRIPPALEQEIQRFDVLRRENEALQMTVESLQTEVTELTTTLEELQKQPDDTTTYKNVGSIMFRVEKPKLAEELEDRKRTKELRLASMSKRLGSSTEKLKELQAKIQIELGKHDLKLQ
jgi:prefoldin beta subunit